MDQHTLQVLEFDKIRELVAQKALSTLGRESAAELAPLTDREKICATLTQVSELKGLFQKGEDLPLQGIKDIRAALAKCSRQGAVLEPSQFLDIGEILAVCERLRAFTKDHQGEYPHLEASIQELRPLKPLRRKIEEKIDGKGRVRDNASKKLHNLRKESETARDRILSKLRSLLSSLSRGRDAKEGLITLREGRYVIPLRGDQRNRIQGVIHDRSASGSTLFVEPTSTIELGNRLREMELEEKKEVIKILRSLTRLVAENEEFLTANLLVLKNLDLLYAKAQFSLDLDAVQPELNDQGILKLKKARHPLLMLLSPGEEEVVPLDVELGENFYILLVTGPNTGGKTVTLKTLGLLSLMVQSGLLIPAHSDSEVPIFQKIYADIGDEQSIEQSLSTFSSHLRQIIQVLEHADHRTLVLLDEIGVGTDPEEGAALAMAVLEVLASRAVRTVATTHYGSLKLFAHNHSEIENASLEFDRQTLRPTYRFRVGLPGSSYALEIANRLGMSSSVVRKAAGLLGEDRQKTAELIEDLNQQLGLYEQKNTELQKRERDLIRLTEEYTRKLSHVREEERRIREEAYRDAQAVLAQANASVERVIAQIRKAQANKETIKEGHRILEAESNRIKRRLQDIAPRPKPSPGGVRVGDAVWVESLQAEGEVVASVGRRGRYKIRVGNLTMEVKEADLRFLGIASSESRKSGGSVDTGQVSVDQAVNQIDLRGLMADEAIAELERFMDRAMLAGLNTLWIIHGKGTGALRKRVGDFLRDFSSVKSYRLGAWNEGGVGVTVVELE
jgi:DNA mismatch repair protein MutS2